MYFPLTKELNEYALIIRKLEACAGEAGIPMGEMLAWSMALRGDGSTSNTATADDSRAADMTREQQAHHDAAVVQQFIKLNRKLSARLRVCEAALLRFPGSHSLVQLAPAPKRLSRTSASLRSHKQNAGRKRPRPAAPLSGTNGTRRCRPCRTQASIRSDQTPSSPWRTSSSFFRPASSSTQHRRASKTASTSTGLLLKLLLSSSCAIAGSRRRGRNGAARDEEASPCWALGLSYR